MKTVKNIVVLVLLGGVIGGCGKDYNFTSKPNTPTTQTNTTNTAKTCRMATMKTIPSFLPDSFSYSFEYNSSGKISKRSRYDNGMLNFYDIYDYSTNGIVEEQSCFAGSTQCGHRIYKLDSNGYASCQISGDNQNDTLALYEHNSDGYLIKSIIKASGAIYIGTITNGNYTQTTVKDSTGKTLNITTYEYTNKVDKIGFWESFLGKGSVNLLSKMIESGASPMITTYSYTFDSNGYPMEVVKTTSFENSTNIKKIYYTYTCP